MTAPARIIKGPVTAPSPTETAGPKTTPSNGLEFIDPALERLASFWAEQGASQRRRKTLWAITGALAVTSIVAISCAIYF